MSAQELFRVAGVDGCKAGWCAAIVRAVGKGRGGDADRMLELESCFVASTFAAVLARGEDCALVCVDIPIGLCDGQAARECDTAARRLVGGRRASSVFPTPVRPCLSADDYETACRISLEHSGRKLSRQSFGLLKKIGEVDGLMTPELQERVREIHPEVSFWVLNGNRPIGQSKRTARGRAQRSRLLARVIVGVDAILTGMQEPGCSTDDALDALVAAWTAAQTVSGKTATLPENPVSDHRGLRMEILCPAV
jgi:predicted RNase H-like nuclease